VTGGAHDPGDGVELLQHLLVDEQQALTLGGHGDLPLTRLPGTVDAVAGQRPGHDAGRVVLVHPGLVGPLLLHIYLEATHALQAADIAHVEDLSAGESRVLARPRLYARHVVQGLLAHGFLGRDDPEPWPVKTQLPAIVTADPTCVRRLAPAGTADRTVAGRVGLPAGRTGRDGALAPSANEFGPQGDFPYGTDGRPGQANFLAQAVTVLLLFGL
jgi:hypothetical protein